MNMNIQDLENAINIIKALGVDSNVQPELAKTQEDVGFKMGEKVIVRSRDAGVLYGEFNGNDGSTVKLKNAIQMWQWKAFKGISLIDVATYGVEKSGCKFSAGLADVTIFNACALIAVDEEAKKTIEAVNG